MHIHSLHTQVTYKYRTCTHPEFKNTIIVFLNSGCVHVNTIARVYNCSVYKCITVVCITVVHGCVHVHHTIIIAYTTIVCIPI